MVLKPYLMVKKRHFVSQWYEYIFIFTCIMLFFHLYLYLHWRSHAGVLHLVQGFPERSS